jgi:hypothetical protein
LHYKHPAEELVKEAQMEVTLIEELDRLITDLSQGHQESIVERKTYIEENVQILGNEKLRCLIENRLMSLLEEYNNFSEI